MLVFIATCVHVQYNNYTSCPICYYTEEVKDLRAGASVKHRINNKMLEDLLDESDTDSDAGAYQEEGEMTDRQEQSEEEEHRQPAELLQEESTIQEEQNTVKQEVNSNEELVTAAARPCE